MKHNQSPWKESIFVRLVFTFMLIMIPIYAMSISIHNWGIRTVRNEISKSTIAQAAFYLESLEKEIERIKILQYDCMYDKALRNVIDKWDIEENYILYPNVTVLQQRLNTIRNSSVYIKDVFANIPSFGKKVSAKSGMSDLQRDEFKSFRANAEDKGSMILYLEGGMFLTTYVAFSTYDANPECSIVIELDQNALINALKQFDTYTGSKSFMINTSKNSILSSKSSGIIQTYINNSTVNWITKKESDTMSVVIEGDRYFAIYSRSDYLNMVLLRYIPEYQVFQPVEQYSLWIWGFVFVSVAIIVIFSISTFRLIQRPLTKLIHSFGKIENGNLDIYIDHNHSDEFRYIYGKFNEMVKRLNILINTVYKQELLVKKAELKQLQSQINPHFLYNSFFILHRIIKANDHETSLRFTKQLGNYFKYITRNAAEDATLFREIEYARTYTDIQTLRFSNRIEIRFDELPPEYSEVVVPKLVIQPIIENAFEHGLNDKEQNGVITVAFEETAGNLSISVEDNGMDLSDQELAKLRNNLENNESLMETTGILNIHRRIRLKFGQKYGLTVVRGEMGGLKVNITIPVKSEE